jgi:hypothetical protein
VAARPVIEHLLVLPDRDLAEEVAEDLLGGGHLEVRVVREALSGEDDAEDHEWAVYVLDGDDVDERSARARLETLAHAHGGWYDADPHGHGR